MPPSPVGFALAFSTGLVVFVFALSGAAKIGRTQKTLNTMSALRVPDRVRVPWIAFLLPVCELLLSAVLLFGSGALRVAAGGGAIVALAAFTALLIGVLRRGEEVDCGCFGPLSASDRVTGWSVARNIVLILASVIVVLLGGGAEPFVVGLVEAGWSEWSLLILAWAVTALIVLGRELFVARRLTAAQPVSQMSRGPAIEGPSSLGDQIPEAELVSADGLTSSLSTLGQGLPVVLVFLSAECASCASVASRLPRWQELLEPVMVRVATSSRPDLLLERMPAALPLAVFGAWESKRMLGVQHSPAAVLLGGHQQPVIASPVAYGLEEIEALVRGVLQAREQSRD